MEEDWEADVCLCRRRIPELKCSLKRISLVKFSSPLNKNKCLVDACWFVCRDCAACRFVTHIFPCLNFIWSPQLLLSDTKGGQSRPQTQQMMRFTLEYSKATSTFSVFCILKCVTPQLVSAWLAVCFSLNQESSETAIFFSWGDKSIKSGKENAKYSWNQL